jgi:hypothetical protein
MVITAAIAMRMVSGPMSGAGASVTTSAVPPIRTARPEVSTARLEAIASPARSCVSTAPRSVRRRRYTSMA